MRILLPTFLLILCASWQVNSASAQESAPAAPPELIGILSPGIPGALAFEGTSDGLARMTYGASSAVTMNKGKALTEQARTDGFDVAARFTDQLVKAFTAQHRITVLLDVQRRVTTKPQPLARDQIPIDLAPEVKQLLDVSVNLIGIDTRVERFEPFVEVSYRVLGRSGQMLQGSRAVTVNAVNRSTTVGSVFKGEQDLREDALPIAQDCKFQLQFDVAKDGAKLWSCLDQALADIATRIAADPIWATPRLMGTSLD